MSDNNLKTTQHGENGGPGPGVQETQQRGNEDGTKLNKLLDLLTRNSVPAKHNYFGSVFLTKADGFPCLYSINPSTSVPSRIPADEGQAWTINANVWFA